MAGEKKDARNYRLIEYLMAGHTVPEAAKEFEISHQRVCQLIKYYKLDLSARKTHKEILFEKIVPLLGTMRDTDLAQMFGATVAQIRFLREKHGVGAFLKPVGCANCKTKPYAKRMCRKCYERKRRRALRKSRQGKPSSLPTLEIKSNSI